MTFEEVLLWNKLKQNQLGVDFDRQRPIDNYIVDFYCKELQLAIKIDGSDHEWEKDQVRQQKLESLGVRFLRFSNKNIKTDMSFVLNEIALFIEEHRQKTHP